jgi:hypothetical protein
MQCARRRRCKSSDIGGSCFDGAVPFRSVHYLVTMVLGRSNANLGHEGTSKNRHEHVRVQGAAGLRQLRVQ